MNYADQLESRIDQLHKEIARLKRGDVTPLERAVLCAGWDELFIPPQPVFGPRSPHWDEVRNEVVADHPYCAASGMKTGLEVHHIMPYHLRPDLELRKDNLAVLARPYHFLLGHFCNWQKFNANVVKDAAHWLGLVRAA